MRVTQFLTTGGPTHGAPKARRSSGLGQHVRRRRRRASQMFRSLGHRCNWRARVRHSSSRMHYTISASSRARAVVAEAESPSASKPRSAHFRCGQPLPGRLGAAIAA